MYVTMHACMHVGVCMCVVEVSLCVCIYIRTYIYYMFCTYRVFCYVIGGGGGGGTVVSLYSFCILYVLRFDDFLR